MTRKKKADKLTFLVIRDVQSSVVRFRLSRWVLIAPAVVFALVAACAAILFALRAGDIRTAADLRSQLAASETKTSEQDRMISDLQNHVIDLSHQAEDVRAKLEQMKALEQTLKGLTGQISPGSIESFDIGGIAMDSASAEDDDLYEEIGGIGGSLNEVSDEEVIALSVDTSRLLTDLDEQLDALKQSLSAVQKQAEIKKHELDMTPTVWPTEAHRITSGFGYRIDPFSRRASFHKGIDIGVDINTPIFATADGVVSLTGQDAAHGKHVIINHTKGIQTHYMHLNKILVNDGDSIKKGQQIALSGNTGRSTGPHLHYEIMKNGVPIDPKPYLEP